MVFDPEKVFPEEVLTLHNLTQLGSSSSTFLAPASYAMVPPLLRGIFDTFIMFVLTLIITYL